MFRSSAPIAAGAKSAPKNVSEGEPAVTVDLNDPKNRIPEPVSINRDATLSALGKTKTQADQRLPEAAEGEVVAIADASPAKAAAPAEPVAAEKTQAAKTEAAPTVAPSETPSKVVAAAKADVKSEASNGDAKDEPTKIEAKREAAAVAAVAPAAPKGETKEEAPKVEVKKEETAVSSAAPVTPKDAPAKVVADAKADVKAEAPKGETKEEAPKVEVKKEETAVASAAPVTPKDAPTKVVADAKADVKAEAPKGETKEEAPKVEVKKEDTAVASAAPVTPKDSPAKVVADAKADVKAEAPKGETKEEAPKVEAKKEEPAVAVTAPAVPEKIVAEAKADVKTEAAKVEVKKDDAVAVAAVPAPKVDVAESIKAAQAKLDQQAGAKIPAAIQSVPAVNEAAPTPNVAAKIDGGSVGIAKSPAQVADDDKDKDKNPPKPETPPVNETPEQKAARLLKEADKLAGIQGQATKQDAEAAYQAGLRLFNDWEYEKAKGYFEKALAIDPTHAKALEKLRTVKALLNIGIGLGQRMNDLANRRTVEMQQTTITLANLMEEARSFENRGSETVTAGAANGDNAAKITVLADRLRFLEQAQDRYRRMVEIINWLPPSAEMPGLRRDAEEALARVRGKIAKIDEEVSFNNREIALKSVKSDIARDTELFKIRIAKMLENVKALYDQRDYKGAEQMAIRVLINDPLNKDAESWKFKARGAAHTAERAEFQELYHEEYRNQILDNYEASVSIAPLIKYPDNWDQISKRSDVSIGRKVAEEPWKAEIRKRLQRKVSFEFVDTPLADAVEFLRHLANVTMIIDPKVLSANPPQINLRVTDMNLDLALEWILKLAELEYALQDSAIFISKPQTLQPPLEMKIYDVSDLTQNITDFPGPEFQITVAGDKNAAGGGGGAPLTPFGGPPKTAAPTNATIQEMIKTRIRPDMWDPATGASIEEKGGKLVVMQRPEIHELINQLLGNFRSTQKMMINIESRFLNIREAYLEQTGVEFQGLDPNVLFGDFGDLRRLGAPTGFLQPRAIASTDTTPPNLPFPGFVNGPDAINGGTFSEVGSIVNHAINFFTNDPDTISAQDTTNTVRQGGLSAQVTILNNAQVQAFIRALAVRENSSTLIAPRLTVFNTQRANMFVARQQSYVADYEISGDSYDPVVRQFLVGVVLDVKPIVSSDRRYVTLELRPTVTTLVNFVTRQIDTFTVNSGAQVNVIIMLSFPIQFPELSITRVRTTATVPDGGIMLIGGLYTNTKFNAENGVPFLSDLPVVGRLFRWNVVDNEKSNLAILVSPRIILFNEEEEKLLR